MKCPHRLCACVCSYSPVYVRLWVCMYSCVTCRLYVQLCNVCVRTVVSHAGCTYSCVTCGLYVQLCHMRAVRTVVLHAGL